MRDFRLLTILLCGMIVLMSTGLPYADTLGHKHTTLPRYQVWPIGWIRKHDGKTFVEVEKPYLDAMLGLEALDEIWVLYWFDRNDKPEKRNILQVHPFGDPSNPLRGVFATRAPVRPNLIALSRCRILSIQGQRIEIDYIDAFADTPVLDIKP